MEDERNLVTKAYNTAIGLEQIELELVELNAHEPLSPEDRIKRERLILEARKEKQEFADAIRHLSPSRNPWVMTSNPLTPHHPHLHV
jgi:hypothetical protein